MELAIINGTYREPNLFPKKLQQNQYPNTRMPIGAPLILTPRIQQNLLAAQLQSGGAPAMFATQGQPTLTAVPQGSIIQTTSANGEPNFVQFFGPLQTLDHMGGMLAGGAQLFEYPAHLDPSQAGTVPHSTMLGHDLSLSLSLIVFSISIFDSGNHDSSRQCCSKSNRYQIESLLFLVARLSVDITHLLLLPKQTSSLRSTAADG